MVRGTEGVRNRHAADVSDWVSVGSSREYGIVRGIVKLTKKIQPTDPQDIAFESRCEAGMLGVELGRSTST